MVTRVKKDVLEKVEIEVWLERQKKHSSRQFPPAKAQTCYEQIINVRLINWFDRDDLSCQAEHEKGGVSFSGFGLKAKMRNSVLDSLDW